MTDNGIDTLPLEAFTQIAGKEAGDLVNSLRQAQGVLDFTLRGDDAVRAIMAARRSPDALNKIGKQFIKPETSPLEISEVKNLLKTQGMNTQTVDDMFADMTINKILGDDLMTNQLSGDDLLNGIITSRLDKYVGDGATYSRQTLEQLLGGGQAGKIAYENLKYIWRKNCYYYLQLANLKLYLKLFQDLCVDFHQPVVVHICKFFCVEYLIFPVVLLMYL